MRSLVFQTRTIALATLLWVAIPGPAAALEIGPESDLCSALAALPPGEELLLRSGDYRGGCRVRRGGQPGRPLVIRAADPAHRPRLIPPGYPANLLEIHASDVVIRELDFWGGRAEVDGIRVISGHRITIEACSFSELGGIAVASTHTNVHNFTVRRNVVMNSYATGMYFGCHDGMTCSTTGLVVEGNYIRGIDASAEEIGYGVEVKLNSSGLIRNNRIMDTKGPGIMVYGSRDMTQASVVERNFVRGSRTSAGILVGGGPAVIRNNISVENFQAGVGLENYERRGLLRGISILHNTVYSNRLGGISAPDSGPLQAAVVNNAIHARTRTPALPRARPGVQLWGNVTCLWATCFTNPEGLDFSPFPGSLLVGPAVVRGQEVVAEDFFGSPRRIPAAIGAVERPSGPIDLGGNVRTP